MNLELRRFLLRIYGLIAPWVSKTGIPKKIHFKETTSGHIISSLFFKILHFKFPEPIEVYGMLMYHRALDGEAWTGWFYAFDFETQTRRAFEQITKPGMTVVDVGANIGYYTLLAAKLVGDKGKVYAFEPDPSFYMLLKKNIEVNGLSAVVEAFRLAISNQEKKATLFLGKGVQSSLFNTPGTTDKTVMVDVISLDKFFSQRDWPVVHIVKIDAEGADKFVLESMQDLIKRNRDIKIIVELNPNYLEHAGTSGEALLQQLVKLGFKQVRALFGRGSFYKIPLDSTYLVHLARESVCINLLCER